MTRPAPAESGTGQVELGGSIPDGTRRYLREHGITDVVIDAFVRPDREGWRLRWDDGSGSPWWLKVYAPTKRPADGRKAEWPSKARGGSTIGPNILRMPTHPVGVLVVEGLKQSLAALSCAPEGWAVVGISGVRGVHKGNVGRCSWAKGLPVVLLPDADYRSNRRVKDGADETARLLREAGAAEVRLAPSPGVGKDGIDDVLGRTVPEKRSELLATVIEDAAIMGGSTATSRLDDAFFELSALENLPAPEPLLTGLLDKATVNVLAGRFGTYKSFVALAWGASLASGQPWGHHTVPEACPVIYVAAEGARGILRRFAAWQEKNGAIPSGAVHVVTRPVHMTSEADAEWLREKVRETGAGLVVIDTWRQSTPGAEENSNTEMSAAFSRAASIRSDTGAAVLILHHTGHAGERSRGASSIEDDADSTFVIKRDGEDTSRSTVRVIEHRKAKDTEALEPFALVAHEVGGSLVVEPDPTPFAAARRRGRPKDGGKEQAVEELVRKLDEHGFPNDLSVRRTQEFADSKRMFLRVSGPIVREAVKVRQAREPQGSDDQEDDLTVEGVEACSPLRGRGYTPHSPSRCGGNSLQEPPRLPPAETLIVEGVEEMPGGFSSTLESAGVEEMVTSTPDVMRCRCGRPLDVDLSHSPSVFLDCPECRWEFAVFPDGHRCPECGELALDPCRFSGLRQYGRFHPARITVAVELRGVRDEVA